MVKSVPAAKLLKENNLEPMELHAKEGLALINGTQFILSHGITALTKMRYLLDLADMTGAMSIEGMQGSESPFRDELHQTRAFRGNLEVAARMRTFFKDSQNMADHEECDRVQDPYSLRCIPQVHGASRNAYYHLEELVEIEMNSVTDNPIVISSEEAISGGSFHGQPLAMVLDYASIAAAELGNISDRRCYLLLEGLHGLPRLLTNCWWFKLRHDDPTICNCGLGNRKQIAYVSHHQLIVYQHLWVKKIMYLWVVFLVVN